MAIFAICKVEHYDGKSHTKVGEKRTDITFSHSHAALYDFFQEPEALVRPLVKVEAPAAEEAPKYPEAKGKKGTAAANVDL
jgi:hypothetical protein